MSTLGFDKYVEPLKIYLAKYREAVKGDKPGKGGVSCFAFAFILPSPTNRPLSSFSLFLSLFFSFLFFFPQDDE